MKKIVSTILVAMLCFVIGATAQTRSVTGRVTDEKGDAVPFASVVIKGAGARTGTSADATGSFTIKAKRGDVLEISAVGFQSQTITYADQTTIGVSLKAGDNTLLKEVVITSAFETKKSSRSSSINAQTVAAEQLNTSRQLNVNNALAGKVAGIQVQSQSATKLGAETNVRIRGENGINAASTALYVVNGTQMPSAADINPDDIETITVLEGPNAAALFGPLGANGAIVITTKKARKGEKGIGVQVTSGVVVDKVYKLPLYQDVYAGGGSPTLIPFTFRTGMPAEWQAMDGKLYPDYTDDASWGPAMQGQEYIPWYAWYPGTQYSNKTARLTPQPTNARDFYQTGVTVNNNVAFSKATDNSNTRVSFSNISQTGTLPTSKLNKYTFMITNTVDLNSHFTLSSNINYVTQTLNGEFNDGYSNNSTGSFSQWFHRDLDFGIMKELRNLRSPQGFLASWNHSNPSSYPVTAASQATLATNQANWFKGNYWYNSFSYFDNVNNLARRDRLYGDVGLTYKVNSDLKMRVTYRKNQNTTYTENKTSSLLQLSGTQTGVNAGYSTSNTFSNRENFEGLISYAKKFNDFDVSANAGFDFFRANSRSVAANTNGGFNVDDYYALSNSRNAISYSNGRSTEQYRAGFVQGNLGYKNFLFADFTVRKDYYSALPPADNSIFIKSFGASFVFSDIIGKSLPWLSFGKLRGSWGEVPAGLGAYDYVNGFNYSVGTNQFNTNFVMGTPNTLVDPAIKGAVNTAKEIGLDLKFAKNRIGLNATYWDQTSKGFPVTASLSGASGISGLLTNAGEVQKYGIDLTLNAKPVWGKDFQWDFNINFSQVIKNEIISLPNDVSNITYSGGSFGGTYVPILVNATGQRWGQLFGYAKKKINGVPVLGTNGLWVKDDAPTYLGSVLPDYTGGVQNSFSYKNWSLNFNIDFQKGGKFASLSDFWGTFSGLTQRTAAINDKGKNVRDDVAAGGGVHAFGVDATGKPVDYYVDAQTYFQQTYSPQIVDNNIYDLTFVKLREVNIGYQFDVKKIGLSKVFQSARLSLTGTNLWLIYSQTKDFDPSEISNSYGENGNFPGTRSIGVNLRVGF